MAKRDRTASSTSVGSDGPPAKATKSGAAAAEDDETDKKKRASQTADPIASKKREVMSLLRSKASKAAGYLGSDDARLGTPTQVLLDAVNQLKQENKLTYMHRADRDGKQQLVYVLPKEDEPQDLNESEAFVLQVITKAGAHGVWTKDIRGQTGLPALTLTKCYKSLESKRLVKTVKSVAAKSKKLYMLYNLTPAKELTGGAWYTDQEFDHSFTSELRAVTLELVRHAKVPIGVGRILETLVGLKIAKCELGEADVAQLVTTLVLDGDVEETFSGDYDPSKPGEGETVKYKLASPPRSSAAGSFKFTYWDLLDKDFSFRRLKFGELGAISAHEPHHHS